MLSASSGPTMPETKVSAMRRLRDRWRVRRERKRRLNAARYANPKFPSGGLMGGGEG